MNHYPGHVRDAFIEWADAGFPESATIEENYQPVEESADDFLRRFLDCSDTMPSDTREQVATQVGWDDYRSHEFIISYAVAATALLVARAVDDRAACAFLEKVLALESV